MINAKVISFQHHNNQEQRLQSSNEIAEKKQKEEIKRELTKGYLKMLSNYYS